MTYLYNFFRPVKYSLLDFMTDSTKDYLAYLKNNAKDSIVDFMTDSTKDYLPYFKNNAKGSLADFIKDNTKGYLVHLKNNAKDYMADFIRRTTKDSLVDLINDNVNDLIKGPSFNPPSPKELGERSLVSIIREGNDPQNDEEVGQLVRGQRCYLDSKDLNGILRVFGSLEFLPDGKLLYRTSDTGSVVERTADKSLVSSFQLGKTKDPSFFSLSTLLGSLNILKDGRWIYDPSATRPSQSSLCFIMDGKNVSSYLSTRGDKFRRYNPHPDSLEFPNGVFLRDGDVLRPGFNYNVLKNQDSTFSFRSPARYLDSYGNIKMPALRIEFNKTK